MLRRLKAPNAAAIHLAARLAEKLFTHYAIVVAVQCPPSGRIVVNYERTIIPGLQLRRWQRGYRIAWCRARLRVLLGARPVDISLALENAWTSRSYHLVVDGGDGIYVGMQASPRLLPYLDSHLGAGKGSVPSVADLSFGRRGGDISDDPPTYFRFRRRLGQSYAHFYCRYLPEPPAHSTAPRIRFRFYEVPPGSTFQAMVAAAASAVLVWIIGFVISRRPELDSDAPAYLLVFPAAAAAWLGFDRPNRRLIEGTLAGRLSLLITALISLIASAFYMIDKSGLLLLNTHNPAKLRVLGIDKLSWSVLALISILSFSAIAFNYVLGLAQFIHFSTRQSYLVEHREHA